MCSFSNLKNMGLFFFQVYVNICAYLQQIKYLANLANCDQKKNDKNTLKILNINKKCALSLLTKMVVWRISVN